MIEILSNGKISGNIIIINSIFDLKNKDITNKIIVTKELTLEMLTDIYNVKGIIVENGNLLSHIFIFLREIGIPCIKQENATRNYKENDFVDI
jgi:phosphohistidine swiveling domain-containing protein